MTTKNLTLEEKDNLSIKTLKINGVGAINKANSGHPGIVLGASTMLHTLYTRHMNFDPKNPKWINRDRFVLSAGHGSALLYSMLNLLELTNTDELKKFRQLHSKTAGHPEYGFIEGIEATSGPLGQGIAMAVGLAIAEESLRARFNEINHYTYVICGDGDLQEGVAMEALSFAGRQQLNKLIIMHDSNDIQLDTSVSKVFNEDLSKKMEAMGFNYILVKHNTVKDIDKAITEAKKSKKPTFIEIKTIIGEGSTNQGTSKVHGSPLGQDIEVLKNNLKWTEDEFFVPEEVRAHYHETIFARGQELSSKFKASAELEKFLSFKSIDINLTLKENDATRNTSGEVVKFLNANVENWIGGSADLSGSTKAAGGDGDFMPENRKGRNILFGVREFAMAAMANGIALHSNFRPFVSTFFVFSDYLKPALRLSAIMQLPVTFVLTHDSIYVGEDGPTHQPIEQLAMLRSIPNVDVLRPADEKEVIGAYQKAMDKNTTPSVIVLTRQNIKSLPTTSVKKFATGAYHVVKNSSDWTIVATGSELANAVRLGEEFKVNVVSLTSFKDAKINWNVEKAISIECLSTFGWAKFAKHNIGIDTFGESGPGEQVYKHFKLDYDSLVETVKNIIK